MKKIFIVLLVLAALIAGGLYGFRHYTKSFSPEAKAVFTKNEFNVTVDYCRPYKKGREIFGGLVPYGKVWRTGANEATEIEFNQNVDILNYSLDAGRYTLFTIPEKDHWTIVFNTILDQWGAFDHDPSKDILRVKVPVTQLPNVEEQFTIRFQDANERVEMYLEWDLTKAIVPIKPKGKAAPANS